MLSIYPHMMRGESLAEFVKRVRREKKLSLVDVERNSRRRGTGISNGYVSQIENGQNTNPTVEALKGLAEGLGVSEDVIFAVARGKCLSPNEQHTEEVRQILDDYSDIPPQCQKDVRDLLAVLRKNHSISERLKQIGDKRAAAASVRQDPSKAAARLNASQPPDRNSPEDEPEKPTERRPLAPYVPAPWEVPGRDSELDDEPRPIYVPSAEDIIRREQGEGEAPDNGDENLEGRPRKHNSR